MATVKEFYSIDFNHTLKLKGKIPQPNDFGFEVPGFLLYDFTAGCCFVSFYFEQTGLSLATFKSFLIHYKERYHALWAADGQVVLPSSHLINGLQVKVENSESMNMEVSFPGDLPIHTKDLTWSGRMYIYSESDLSLEERQELYDCAKGLKYDLQFRSQTYQMERTKNQRPLAFISHDSRDKDTAARAIAAKLTSMGCPVWYDEYRLKVGDELRKSIEAGIKECDKCIVLLSKNFFANDGWTKTEFESIFIKQVLKGEYSVLPVWLDVTKEEVYEYSPSLLNIFGLSWQDGEDKVCKKLFSEIVKEKSAT